MVSAVISVTLCIGPAQTWLQKLDGDGVTLRHTAPTTIFNFEMLLSHVNQLQGWSDLYSEVWGPNLERSIDYSQNFHSFLSPAKRRSEINTALYLGQYLK